MPPDEFAAALSAIGWTRRGLAKRLGMSAGGVDAWAAGRASIPPELAAWLRAHAAFHKALPLPTRDDLRARPPKRRRRPNAGMFGRGGRAPSRTASRDAEPVTGAWD